MSTIDLTIHEIDCEIKHFEKETLLLSAKSLAASRIFFGRMPSIISVFNVLYMRGRGIPERMGTNWIYY